MYFRARVKQKKFSHYRELRGAALLAAAFLYGYCVVLPDQSGAIGRAVANISTQIFGAASFLLPLLIAWAGISHLRTSLGLRARLDALWSLLLAISASSILSMIDFAKNGAAGVQSGGWVGLKLNPFFFRLFGTYISIVILAAAFVYLASLLLRVSLRNLAIIAWHKLAEDYNQWQEARKDIKKVLPPRIRAAQEPKNARPAPAFETAPVRVPADRFRVR